MKIKQMFLPGSEWVFYKFYVGEGYANKLLIDKIYPLIRKQFDLGRITQWFFIRYFDSGNHLRIRLLSSSKDSLAGILWDFEAEGQFLIREGFVSEITISTYKRELLRYGKSNIKLIEQLWYWESELVVNGLIQFNNGIKNVLCALTVVDVLLNEMYGSSEKIIDFVEMNYSRFCSEFKLSKPNKRKMAHKFRDIHVDLENWTSEPSSNLEGFHWYHDYTIQMKTIIREIRSNTTPETNSSIIHMFLNRIFDKSQRKMELVVYHHLLKFYKSIMAKENKIA